MRRCKEGSRARANQLDQRNHRVAWGASREMHSTLSVGTKQVQTMTYRPERLRCCLLAVVLAGSSLFGSAGIAHAQHVGGNWPSRCLQIPPLSDRGLAPVVTAVCLQPGGGLLAVAGDDHHVYLWDLTVENEVRRLAGHTDWVCSVRFSPDGRMLASAGQDGRVILWDPIGGKLIGVLEQRDQAATELAWSHKGDLLAVGDFAGRLRIYDVSQGTFVTELEGPSADLRAVVFAPDDRLIAAGGRCGTVRVWHREDAYRGADYKPHSQRIRALTFSPDGRLLLSSGDDRKIHVRSLASEQGVNLPPRPAKVYALTFIAPRYLAAGGSDNLIRIWDLSNATEVGRLAGHQGSVATLDCNANILVSGGYDTVVRIWTIKDRVAKLPRETRELK